MNLNKEILSRIINIRANESSITSTNRSITNLENEENKFNDGEMEQKHMYKAQTSYSFNENENESQNLIIQSVKNWFIKLGEYLITNDDLQQKIYKNILNSWKSSPDFIWFEFRCDRCEFIQMMPLASELSLWDLTCTLYKIVNVSNLRNSNCLEQILERKGHALHGSILVIEIIKKSIQ